MRKKACTHLCPMATHVVTSANHGSRPPPREDEGLHGGPAPPVPPDRIGRHARLEDGPLHHPASQFCSPDASQRGRSMEAKSGGEELRGVRVDSPLPFPLLPRTEFLNVCTVVGIPGRHPKSGWQSLFERVTKCQCYFQTMSFLPSTIELVTGCCEGVVLKWVAVQKTVENPPELDNGAHCIPGSPWSLWTVMCSSTWLLPRPARPPWPTSSGKQLCRAKSIKCIWSQKTCIKRDACSILSLQETQDEATPRLLPGTNFAIV